jgi:hypothetical protein
MNAPFPLDARHNPALKQVIVICAVVLSWIGLDLGVALYREASVPLSMYPAPPSSLRQATAYLLPAFGLLTIAALLRFARQGRPMMSAGAAIAGLAVILSGAGVDLATTLLISPDLDREGNPYVRALLDSGHSLRFVYIHLGVTQAIFILLFCTFWLAFLRHLPVLVETIVAARPASPLQFLKASTGAARLSLRQWLLPLRPSEVPILYHNVWAIAMSVIFGVTLFRWYAALEWLEKFEPAFWPRAFVLFGGLAGSLLAYFAGLACVYRAVSRRRMA